MNRLRILLALCLAVVVGGALLAGGPVNPEGRVEASDRFTLRLAEFAFDPLQAEPDLPEGWDHSASTVPDLHLVQFDGPIPSGARQTLRAGGIEPIQYIYPNTYIVWGLSADRVGLSGKSSIRWTGDFAPAYRVQPQWRELKGDAIDVKVLIYRGADADSVVKTIAGLGGKPSTRQVVNDRFEVAGFTLPGDRVQAAASIPGVYSIQRQSTDGGSRAEVSAQIDAGNVDGTNVAFPGYQAWLAGLGLDGSGVIVANVDEGVDEGHPDLVARMLPCVGGSCSVVPRSLHGTHTAGIIAGDGSSAVVDANGFLRGLGIAPGANLIEQEYNPWMLQPGGVLQLMTDSYNNGAVASNNSWGTASSVAGLGYDIDTMLVDVGVRDADPLRPGNQPLTYVLAIDNGSGGVSSQGVPDDSKNAFVIGGTKGQLADGNPDPDIDSLADTTAHGPALDGRTVPHMVAPACFVESTYPDWGEGYSHHALCGTSMAAPQVSGAVALFTEYYRSLPGYTGDPSPALVKAAFMPVAHDLDGNTDADGAVMGHRPDSKQGWGRLNLSAVIDPPADSVIYFDQGRVFEESGNEWLREVTPVDPAQPMRIMLVWTDAPGHGLGGSLPAWNNDLDLVVDAGGNTYYGNYFGIDGFSAIGGVADPMNNAEGVFLELPPTDVTIRVVATNLNSDGVPQFNDETDQDFALACYNCAFVSGFALTPDPVTQYICAPDLAEFQIDVEQHSGYTEQVSLSLLDVPAGVIASFDSNPVAPGSTSLLTFDPDTAVSGDYEIQLHGDSIDVNRTHPLFLRLRTAVPVPANPTLPVGGALDVFPQPVLQWDPAPWASGYVIEVTTDPTFEQIFYTAHSKAASHTVGVNLDQETIYYWRVRASNVCGFGDFSPVSSFTTVNVATVLLVDDDYDYYGDFQAKYTDALTALGVAYDVWDVYGVMSQDEPDVETLARYERVVWWSGEEDFYAGPTEESEGVLSDWFTQQSGCLFLTSSDYIQSRGGAVTAFMQEELGVASADTDTGQAEVTAVGSVFGVLGPDPITLKNINPDWSDSVTPDATAEMAFVGDLGTAGINKDGGFYRTAFMGYGAERLFSPADLQNALGTFFGWCDGLAVIDGDADGVINGADCAPGDADAWTTPSPITDLRMTNNEAGGFSWSQPVSGSGSVYDVLRSRDVTDFWNATCVAAHVPGPPPWNDPDLPAPGETFFYLVRARSACGTSTLGNNLDGTARHGTACE